MKFSFKSLKKITPLEIIVILVLISYIVLPIDTPSVLSPIITSSLMLVVLLVLVVYLFLYSHPIIAILSVFVAYELLRRSNKSVQSVDIASMTIFNKEPLPVHNIAEEEQKEPQMAVYETLEEDVVEKMAPIGKCDPETFIPTSYSAIGDNSHKIVVNQ